MADDGQMTRRPGERTDDEDTPGGRAARRRAEHLAARYGDASPDPEEDGSEQPGEESAGSETEGDSSDETGADDAAPGRDESAGT